MGYFVLKPDNNIESGARRPQDEFYRDNKAGIGNIEDRLQSDGLIKQLCSARLNKLDGRI